VMPQDIPSPERIDKNVADLGRYIIVPDEGYHVSSWCPGAAHLGASATQVHLRLCPAPDVSIVLRLKSARALDELVGVLLRHRQDVWGK
jgi:hypothetical protein